MSPIPAQRSLHAARTWRSALAASMRLRRTTPEPVAPSVLHTTVMLGEGMPRRLERAACCATSEPCKAPV